MTTTNDSAWEQANSASRAVAAALAPDGGLYLKLEELLSAAANVAMDATPGLPHVDERGTLYGYDQVDMEEEVASMVAEILFQASLAYIRGTAPADQA